MGTAILQELKTHNLPKCYGKYDRSLGKREYIRLCNGIQGESPCHITLKEHLDNLDFSKCPHTYSFHYTPSSNYFVAVFSIRGYKYNVCCAIHNPDDTTMFYLNGILLGAPDDDALAKQLDLVFTRVFHRICRSIYTRT